MQGYNSQRNMSPYYHHTQALEPHSSWCIICGGSHAAESCFIMTAPLQQVFEYAAKSQRALQQESAQPTLETPSSLNVEAMMDMLQKYQQQCEEGIRQIKELLNKNELGHGDIVRGSPLPSENLKVEENEGNNLEDEELEEQHVIKDPNIGKDYMPETQGEFQEDKDNEQCQVDPLEEEEDQNLAKTAAWLGIEETEKVGEDIEDQEQLEDSYVDKVFYKDELSSGVLNEITQNQIGVEEEDWRVVWKRCFEEENYQKENLEEESIILDIEPQILPVWSMQSLSLKEFLDARHLRIYLDRKVDGEKGLVSTQSIEECDSRGCVELIDVKLSASWEAPHVILYFHAF